MAQGADLAHPAVAQRLEVAIQASLLQHRATAQDGADDAVRWRRSRKGILFDGVSKYTAYARGGR